MTIIFNDTEKIVLGSTENLRRIIFKDTQNRSIINTQYRKALKDIKGEYSKYSSNNKDITLSVCFVSSPAFLRFISRSNPVEYSSPVNENGIRVTRMARDALN